jgi:hypothetical protein
VRNEHIIDNYYLLAIDSESDISISYKLNNGDYIGVVNGGIYAFGYNDDYIILKQHPLNKVGDLIKETTLYYIIPIDKNISQYKVDQNKIGPLHEDEFFKMRNELSIPSNLIFSRLIKENQ